MATRDPKFSHFFEGYIPPFAKEEVESLVSRVKKSREPTWELDDWSRYNYCASFALMREALVAWAAHVEAGTLTVEGPRGVRNDGHPELEQAAGIVGSTDSLPELTRAHMDILFHGAEMISTIALKRAAVHGREQIAEKVVGLDRFKAIPRFHYKDMSLEFFQEHLERPLLPCIISGMTDGWAMREWTAASLTESKYKDCLFKVGKTPDGYRLTLPLKYFLQYMFQHSDDLPLYLFESQLEVIPIAEEIQQDYVRPHFFQTDLFDLVTFNRRPPQRWLTIGSAASGTLMHLDPLNTNAWNSLTHGRKYWVLLSPEVPEDIACGFGLRRSDRKGTTASRGETGPSDVAMCQGWFWQSLPALRALVTKNPNYELLECIQYPGDTIFVPGGYWHAVLNLDDTVAITQNYCNESNFPQVWSAARKRVHMARRWLTTLEQRFPQLAKVAHEINARDGFQFRFSSGSIRRKNERRERIAAKLKALTAGCAPGENVVTPEHSEHDSDDEKSGEWDSSTNSDDSE